jgi:hypothetical protein
VSDGRQGFGKKREGKKKRESDTHTPKRITERVERGDLRTTTKSRKEAFDTIIKRHYCVCDVGYPPKKKQQPTKNSKKEGEENI